MNLCDAVFAISLTLLAGVALVPLPTSLIGADPGASSSAVPFIGIFALLSLVSFAFIVRAHRLGAWREPLAPRLFRWILVDWGTNLAILLACLLVAFWWPLTALILLLVASAVGTAVTGILGPRERRAWF